MSSDPRSLAARWKYWYRRALPAYVVFLCTSTHLPNLRLQGENADKRAHLMAFAALGFLYWRFWETFRRPGPWFALSALGTLAAYAGLDEYSQQFFGRSTDIEDWYMDMLGVSVTLLLLEVERRWIGGSLFLRRRDG